MSSSGLRLMIYDKTDVKGWAQQLKAIAPDQVDELVDELDINVGLSTSWASGGWLYRQFGRFDAVMGCSSWAEALEWLCSIEPEREIAEVQFWGHGSPGKVWLNGTVIGKSSFSVPLYSALLQRLKTRLTEESLIWFRCCSVFAGQAGHSFASAWTENMGCRVASHTYVIHFLQSGLYCLSPGEQPFWPMAEGINEGTVDKPASLRWSVPWAPRTIFAIQSRLPRWAGP